MGREQEVILGICGGVGPAAGLLLHQLILQNTITDGSDQSHLPVIHFSRSHDMTDRTAYLLSSSSEKEEEIKEKVENPACGMARTFAMMRAAATQGYHVRLVTGVPCNTFHAQPIWDEFLRLTAEKDDATATGEICHVHMLQETVRLIAQCAPAATRIGLLATTGTRHSRVYHDLMEPLGYTIIEISPSLQSELHECIYHPQWGIKSTAPTVTRRCVTKCHRYVKQLIALGAQVVVLGCTEIPFAFTGKTRVDGVLLIDPMLALARAMIFAADPSRLKPLKVGKSTRRQRRSRIKQQLVCPATYTSLSRSIESGTCMMTVPKGKCIEMLDGTKQ